MKDLILIFLFFPLFALSQIENKQHNQLILRGATIINSTGAPPLGPVDIVIEKNIITKIQNVGYPGVPINDDRRPKLSKNGVEIDCEGSYVLPGFIDTHGHIGGKSQGASPKKSFEMAKEINSIYFPNILIAASKKDSDRYLLKNRYIKGENLIYVCVNNTCKFPVNNVKEALNLITQSDEK